MAMTNANHIARPMTTHLSGIAPMLRNMYKVQVMLQLSVASVVAELLADLSGLLAILFYLQAEALGDVGPWH